MSQNNVTVNREYKSSLFARIFSEPEAVRIFILYRRGPSASEGRSDPGSGGGPGGGRVHRRGYPAGISLKTQSGGSEYGNAGIRRGAA